MSSQLIRRLDRLLCSGKLAPAPTADQVTADELFTGKCFTAPRAWRLEDLVSAIQEQHCREKSASCAI